MWKSNSVKTMATYWRTAVNKWSDCSKCLCERKRTHDWLPVFIATLLLVRCSFLVPHVFDKVHYGNLHNKIRHNTQMTRPHSYALDNLTLSSMYGMGKCINYKHYTIAFGIKHTVLQQVARLLSHSMNCNACAGVLAVIHTFSSVGGSNTLANLP